jgi:hyperosmotically inducible periplasmic protein
MNKVPLANHTLLGGVLLAAIALAGCNRQEPPKTAGQKLDTAIEKSKDMTQDATKSAGDAARATGTALSDTAITAAVKGKLAADPDLKMLDISVETTAGRTVLQGTAPNAASRDRATKLAAAVSGVSDVDNRLTVKQ